MGAGVTGLFVAPNLGRLGVDAVTVDERTGIGAGASGVQPGGIRQQWGTEINCVLARESLATYRDAQARLEMRVDPCFRACGYLFLAHSAETLARLAANVELQNGLGVASRIVEPDEAAAARPWARPVLTRGCRLVRRRRLPRSSPGGARGARRTRHDRARAGVVGLRQETAGWRLAFADGTSSIATNVVVAAGWESRALIPELPIEREARYLFLSEPVRERLLDPLVISPGASLRGEAAGRRPRAGQRPHCGRRSRPRTRPLAKSRA